MQVKICGLTIVENAVECASLGADAIGLVFYPPSPRHVTDEQAVQISRALPQKTVSVGVFVDESLDFIMDKAEKCGLGMVQLHGAESRGLTAELEARGVRVIKTLFENRAPYLSEAGSYTVSALLAECAGEKLPGGNAKAWDWRKARGAGRDAPLVLAGGLNPDNVAQAAAEALPDAVDVSSGVEAAHGIKT